MNSVAGLGFLFWRGTIHQLALLPLLSLLRNSWKQAQSRSEIDAEEAPQCGWSPETHCCGHKAPRGLSSQHSCLCSRSSGMESPPDISQKGPEASFLLTCRIKRFLFSPQLFLFSKETLTTVEKISNFFLIR